MIIYFLIVAIGSVIAGRLILGELKKERRDYVVLVEPTVQPVEKVTTAATSETKTPPADFISPAAYTPFVKIEREAPNMENWESILALKNAEIDRLAKDLESQKNQTQEFEKIKVLLERQIFESRQMNRTIKRELDALMAQGQKSQDEMAKLQMEINYKNQLINQHEIKMSELKNRISKLLPNATPAQEEPAQNDERDLGNFSFDQLDWRKKLTE